MQSYGKQGTSHASVHLGALCARRDPFTGINRQDVLPLKLFNSTLPLAGEFDPSEHRVAPTHGSLPDPTWIYCSRSLRLIL